MAELTRAELIDVFGNFKTTEFSLLCCFLQDLSLLNEYPVSESDLKQPNSKELFELITIMERKKLKIGDSNSIKLELMNHPHLKAWIKEFGTIEDIFKQGEKFQVRNIASYYDSFQKRNYLVSLFDLGFNLSKYKEDLKDLNFEDTVKFVEGVVNQIGLINNSSNHLEINELDLTDELIDEILQGQLHESLSFKETCPLLNKITDGAIVGGMMLICGLSNVGKTTFTLSNLVYPMIKQGHKVLLISNEMSYKQYMEILISLIAYKELGDYSLTRDKLRHGDEIYNGKARLKAVQKYINDHLKGSIKFINYYSGNIEVIKKSMKCYAKDGFKVCIYDNFKAENSANARAWAEIIEHSKTLTFTAGECGMIFIAPYQIAPASADKRILGMNDLSEGKNVIGIASTCLMLRRLKDNEFKDEEYDIKPYKFVKNAQGNWKTELIELDRKKQYIVLSVIKNRSGETGKYLIYEFDGSHGIYKELGYCNPKADKGK